MKKLSGILIILIVLLNSCSNCTSDGINGHEFTETDYEYFTFTEGDTIFYIDRETSEKYYIVCESKEIILRNYYNFEDQSCGETIEEIQDIMHYNFISNLPFFDLNPTKFTLEVKSEEKYQSRVIIHFSTGIPNNYEYVSQSYGYVVFFDNDKEIFTPNSCSSEDYITHYDRIDINGTTYSNVHAFSFDGSCPGYNQAVFDQIYYNKEGFLKFVSTYLDLQIEQIK